MSLYTIGDLHLHFSSELKAKNQIEGKVWQNHEEIFRRNCEKLIRPEDTLVLVGDHSWGRNLAEAEKILKEKGLAAMEKKIWNTFVISPEGRYYFVEIMICSGMQRKQRT